MGFTEVPWEGKAYNEGKDSKPCVWSVMYATVWMVRKEAKKQHGKKMPNWSIWM